MGNGWAENVHADDLATCMDTYVKAFDDRKPFQMEYRLRRHDGEYRWVFDVGVPRFNADGAFVGYIGSVVDVTTHKLAEEALSKVSQRLIEAQEEERRWITRELHDDICQRLALISFQLGAMSHNLEGTVLLQKLKEINEQAVKLGKDVQGLSHRLHSSSLELLGLVSAVSRFCREFSDRHGVEVEFLCKNFPERVPNEISLCLFRILQEALRNAVKHSGARHFRVVLCGGSDNLQLTVQDEGIGFDPNAAGKGDGLGLISMKERLKLVDGVLTITSQPGSGTMIQAGVPLNTRKAAPAM
jgi:signal transduction histidine kinase